MATKTTKKKARKEEPVSRGRITRGIKPRAADDYEKPMDGAPTNRGGPPNDYALNTSICAAMPVAAASAARPPSSAATRSSSAATVGFDIRE